MNTTGLSEFFTIVGGTAALGYILDQITSTARSEGLKSSSATSLSSIVGIYFQSTHLRIFGSKLNSRHFLFASAIVFLFLLFFVFTLQMWVFDYSYSDFAVSLKFLLPILILSYVIFLVTTAQTQVFVSLFIAADTTIKKIILLFSDIFVSSNLFIFFYSGSIVAALFLYDVTQLRGELEQQSGNAILKVEISENQFGGRTFGDGVAYLIYDMSMFYSKDDSRSEQGEPAISLVAHSSNRGPDLASLMREYVDSSKELTLIYGEETVQTTLSSLDQVVRDIPRLQPFVVEGKLRVLEFKSIAEQYTAAFTNVDRIEDEFGDIFSQRLAAMHLHSVIGIDGGFHPFEEEVYCIFRGAVKNEYQRSSMRIPEDMLQCEPSVLAVTGRLHSIIRFSASPILDETNKLLPLSAVYFVMMIPSCLFYFACVTGYLLTRFRAVFAGSSLGRSVYDTVPFSLTGAILGILLFFAAA